jgi:DHA3 family macrolide efflux protein-like MFS transporter
MLVPDHQRDRANAIQQLGYPSSVVLASAFAGILYAAAGVAGAILIDLSTFIVAIAVLAVVRIPMPEASAAVQAVRRGIWRQSLDGFGYLAGRPVLLMLCMFIAVIGASAGNVFWALMTPYVLDRVHSTTTFGFVVGAGFTGAIAGALAMAAWGGTRPRIHTVMVSTLLAGVGIALTGLARAPIPLAAALFLLTFVIPFVNAALSSIFQSEVARDWQGRVFASLGQLGALLGPIASLVAGPLADRVFEPAVHQPGWRSIAWAVGSAPGAGMGLMYLIDGLWIVGLTVAVYASPAVRRVEACARQTAATPASA